MATRPVDAPLGQLFGENPTGNIGPGHPDYWIIERFGDYQHDGHAGQDYTCRAGTPIRAIAAGTVRHVGYFTGTYADNPWWCAPGFFGYGYVIDHGAYLAEYGHGMENTARVSVGDRVAEGQVIGLSGNTGGSTGDHLHLGILPDGYVLNSKFYGRIDPETIFAGGLSPAGTITPVQEDTMPLTDAEYERIGDVVVAKMMTNKPVSGTNTLGELISEYRPHVLQTIEAINKVPGIVLDTVVDGVAGDRLTLRQFLAEYRSHIIQLTAGIAAEAAAGGSSVEEIRKAVADGLSAGVRVDATVTVGGK